jgi:Putative Ig domain
MRSLRAGAKLSAALTLILVLGLARTAAAQTNVNPLTFGNNYFVTGDYVVGGAYNMNTNMVTIGSNTYTIGTINIPDANNPGITGAKSVPTGAQIVAAFLYWQTVEKIGVMPGQPGSGQIGYFRPLKNGGPPAPGYLITGVDLMSQNTVSFSNGGCTGGSTGKVVRTYRASVGGYLPQDPSGNILANSTYEVRLPSSGSNTPLTLGATLVIIYRVLAPNFPLNSIVIYDGPFAPGGTLLTMTQTVQGFYQAGQNGHAAQNPPLLSRLTHIVGSGHSNKFQNVYLNNLNTPLPSPYRNGLPPFPGWYGSWDNTTWTFDPNQTYVKFANPVGEDSASATTKVVPTTSNQGCVSWGAVIFSTTVKNNDNDGLLDVWKVPAAPNANTPGYCDASVNEGVCKVGDASWVDLPGAVHGEKDVFLQLDYMCSSVTGPNSCDTSQVNPNFTNYSFDPRLTGAVDKMTNAFFLGGGIHLHVNPVNPMGTTQPVHAIQEQTCMDNSNNPLCASVATNGLTPFPGQPGVVGWKAGLEFLKNQPLNPILDGTTWTETQCANNPSTCIRRFQYGRKDSYHYAVFAHAIGRPTWGLQGGSLTSVVALHNTVAFTTAAPHGLVVDPHLGNGRVTIADAITNPNLNGTYLVQSVSPPAGVFAITQTSMDAAGIATYTFSGNPPPLASDLVTVTNTTNGNAVFNVGNVTILTVDAVHSTFTVNFKVSGFLPKAIAAQNETGGCAPAVPTGACAHTNRPPFFFTINITTPVSPQTSYTELTDPNLTVTPGQATTGSGFSDIGGADTLVTLGLWGDPSLPSPPAPQAPGQTKNVQAGTFMHELGHTLGLTHGGLFYDNLAQNPQDYTPTLDANCKSNYQSVMNYMFQSDLLGPNSDVLDFSSQQLGTLSEKLLMSIATTDGSAVKFSTTTWYDLTPNFRIDPLTHLPIQVGSKAKHHCDGSPMFFNANVPPFSADVTPIMYPHVNQALPNPWPAASLDINFDGMIDTGPHGYRGYDDWANIDLRQIGATGSDISGAGHLGGGPGHLGGGPGHLGGGPGHLGGGPGHLGGGPGVEIDFETANAVTRPPRNLMAAEEISPRFIDLSWTAPSFGQIGAYRIYRSADGGRTFALLATVPGSQTTYRDGVTTPPPCNTTGYQYFVTAVLAGTFAAFPPGPTEGQESEPSNTVSTGQNGQILTGCYTPPSPLFVSPRAGSSPLAGSHVAVIWTVQDASNNKGTSANNPGSNSLVAIGPISNDLLCISSTANPPVNTPSTKISAAGSNITFDGTSQFSFNWNTAQGFSGGPFPPGCYRLELDLDSGQPTSGNLPASTFQVQFYLSDVNESVLINTTSLPDATVGIAYNQALQETGGVRALKWIVVPNSGSLPPSFTLDPASGTISGTTLTAGTYQFTVQVTDSIGDFGTQPLTLKVHIFVSTSQPSANPPFVATTTLTNAVVGSPYNNTVYESGGVSDGVKPFTWTIVPGSLTLNGSPAPDGSLGIAFQLNTVAGGNNGTLSGTPTAPGTYTFTAMVTDSSGNTGTQTLTLNVADAVFGDLIVVDGPPSNAPSGTLLRVTQTGTTTGTIATISTGQPNGVAVDSNNGNIYATVAPLAGVGTAGVIQVSQFGTTSSNNTFYNSVVSSGVLKNPVAVAVDSAGNVYVADNQADAIYKFNSSGTLLNPSPFAPLPVSSVMHVRMAFDTNGNLMVASDKVNGASGVIEVDQINTSTGTPTVLYNTLTNAGLTDALTAVNASAAITSFAITNNVVTFQGVNNFTAGTMIQIKGLATGTYLDGQILTVLSNGLSGTQFEANFNNPAVPSTADAGTATTSAAITSFSITSNVVTFQAANNFTAGTMVQINGLSTGAYLNGQTLTVLSAGLSGAQFEANFSNPDVSSTADSGTATASAAITSFAVSNNIVTLQATNTFTAGTMVQISGLTTGTYLNGQTLTVLSTGLSGPQFEANFNNPNVPSTNDSGTATSQTAAYTGTFSPPLPVGSLVAISGFTNNGNNSPINSPFTVVSCTGTTLVVNNPNGISETHAGTATFGIASVGGVATFSDSSIDVADSGMQTIYKITTMPSLAVAPDISTTNALCCNISGMTNPSQGTTLFVTLDQAAQVQQAVPPSTVITILNGKPLTFPNDVTWYSKH